MTLKKLALASAIAACMPMAAHAVESLDDGMLSGVTGQDGLRINLDLNILTDVIIHDTDGINYQAGYSFDGAIVIENFGLTTAGGGITLEIDAGDSSTNTGTAPILNVNVQIGAGTTIDTGDLYVANSNRDDGAWGVTTQVATPIMDSMTITLGATTANIQLGNEAQGNMIALNTTITGGVSIAGQALRDAGGALSGGAIGSSLISILDSGGGPNLSVVAGVDVTATDGVVITLTQLGHAANGMDIRIERQYLGDPALGYVGDVELVGVNLNGSVINISGK